MTIKKALDFFESLKNEASKKREIKVYSKFLHILNELESREFSTDELQSIESELERLELKSYPKNRNRYFKKALHNFETYLKDSFSLTRKGHYTNLYGGLGMSFGVLFGVVVLSSFEQSLGISLGLIFGMLVGATIGRNFDSKALQEGRTL